MSTIPTYDVIVIGGGHAGIEASSAAARMGCRTALITHSVDSIGRLSCNPAVGGMAKGQVVCEIDALGGEMGRLADESGIQFKTLGTKKGPAMWSPRSQNDIFLYPQLALQRLSSIEGLDIIEADVTDISVVNGQVHGVTLTSSTKEVRELLCRAVVLCAGTFLCGRMYTGEERSTGGRVQEMSSEKITGSLQRIGFHTGRLKTGTPPRIAADSIDFTACRIDHGDAAPRPFSTRTSTVSNRIDCHTTWTNATTHEILRTGFDRSPMFTGHITGPGPRYCPSIEDKVFRFADKDGHMLILEPESLRGDSIYVNGFSTSLPEDVQLKALHTIPGLEQSRLLRRGYAVEYDYFPPHQLFSSLMSRYCHGLFFAGQINGTSGYEEAAAQGLMAGINAVRSIERLEPIVLDRSQAYIGVLLDDLSTLNTEEPYRLFTSRAEYRLLLRRDNADLRLSELGFSLGLVSSKEIQRVREKARLSTSGESLFRNLSGSILGDGPQRRDTVWNLLKTPGSSLPSINLDPLPSGSDDALLLHEILTRPAVIEQVEVSARYEGYISRQLRDIERFQRDEAQLIPDSLDYSSIHSLSSEGREKLSRYRPRSLGHASRISGVSRSDLNVLHIYIR